MREECLIAPARLPRGGAVTEADAGARTHPGRWGRGPPTRCGAPGGLRSHRL